MQHLIETSTEENREVPQALDPEIREGKFFAIIGYIFVLCFVPLFLRRDNEFAQFHGRQGLVLFILELASAILTVVPVVGEAAFKGACLIFGIFSLIGIVKAFRNQYWKMPVIYRISNTITL